MNDIVNGLSGIAIGAISLWQILSTVFFAVICIALVFIILSVVKKLLDRTKLDAALKGFAFSGIKVIVWAVGLIMIADKLGFDVTTLVALLSVAGIAISLSVQGLLTNLFSGITILMNHPFKAGDYVELNGSEGSVLAIGLFYTKITTVDNKIVQIPNGQVTGAKIINFTTEPVRRVDLNFTTSYGDKTEDVKSALLEAINRVGLAIDEPAKPFAALLKYNDSNIEYVTRTWVKTADYWTCYFGITENVRTVFEERGIEMTYEHVNVHIVEK